MTGCRRAARRALCVCLGLNALAAAAAAFVGVHARRGGSRESKGVVGVAPRRPGPARSPSACCRRDSIFALRAAAQVFSADVTEYLRQNGLDDDCIAQCSRSLRTPSATCLRVNVLRTTVEDVAISLQELCRAELGHVPPLYQHPALPECIIMPTSQNPALASSTTSSGARVRDLPRVLVGRLCGEAVMQGAHVFAPGMLCLRGRGGRGGEGASVWKCVVGSICGRV